VSARACYPLAWRGRRRGGGADDGVDDVRRGGGADNVRCDGGATDVWRERRVGRQSGGGDGRECPMAARKGTAPGADPNGDGRCRERANGRRREDNR
jgi:hypothetical protein